MNIGDYVRTSAGETGKIIECPEDFKESYGKMLWIETTDEQRPTTKEYIIKSSSNIIDLIEEGDYVNGNKVLEKENYLLWIFDNDKHDTLYFNEEDIKSIVTKEQFKSMEYKIGE